MGSCDQAPGVGRWFTSSLQEAALAAQHWEFCLGNGPQGAVCIVTVPLSEGEGACKPHRDLPLARMCNHSSLYGLKIGGGCSVSAIEPEWRGKRAECWWSFRESCTSAVCSTLQRFQEPGVSTRAGSVSRFLAHARTASPAHAAPVIHCCQPAGAGCWTLCKAPEMSISVKIPALELPGFSSSKKQMNAELYSLRKVGQGALTLEKLEEKCAAVAVWAVIGRENINRAGSCRSESI